MVSRISLYNKVATTPNISGDADVMLVEPTFCMYNNEIAYTVRWMFEGLEDDATPFPYSAEIIKVTWDKDSCSHEVATAISNFTILSGETMKLTSKIYFINHVRYGIHDYIAVVFPLKYWLAYDDPTWPPPWPWYGLKVVCIGSDTCNLNLNYPLDDSTLFLRSDNPTKASIHHGILCSGIDVFDNSSPPDDWVFPDDGPCPPTGNDFCPCPALIIDGSSAWWADDVTVPCTGWDTYGNKELNVNEFHSLGTSAVDPTGYGTFYYLAERLDLEVVLLYASPVDGSTILNEERDYSNVHLYNGKYHAYAVDDSSGNVFIPPGGATIITISPAEYLGAATAFDDKNDMVWTATSGGIVGKSLSNPANDRTITVDWPIDTISELPLLFKYDGNQSLAMRILAGEIILYVYSDNGATSHQYDILILKENLPCNYSQYWPVVS